MPLRLSLCLGIMFIAGCGDNDSSTGPDQTTDEIMVIINEINYNSADNFNPDDWVELYNAGDSQADVSGWIFKDEDDAHEFVLPDSTVITTGGFLVLCADTTAFGSLFPEVGNYEGNVPFGFSGGGELLRLFDSAGELIDQVAYDDAAPWPAEADGLGATLTLLNPEADNMLPGNWAASSGHGTPGAANY